MRREVTVRRETVVLPTYEPEAPDRNPMFLEKRVYQGSSGKVYPLPFFNRISESPTEREWDAIFLNNGLVEVMLLPEIGGRVHALTDLTNGYEAVYRQDVIKPALVGLGGPWVSGGIEFNWPQHHRPSTFMPTDVAMEYGDDGSITVWMGEHEPMDRTKGMHGICLYPNRSIVEIKVRLYNRTPYVQTFLWWTNIGTHVHEGYRSFFPPDAHLVADHAKRAISTYPLCDGTYYGVHYADRARNGVPIEERPRQFIPAHCGGQSPAYAPNDLSWYANIPVPTSYMCVGTEEDFFGGYDFQKRAGIMHVADHHISPGKKQWTWGNQEFGYAWDRNLTDHNGPYIELMAGVFTDNQPDFSFIAPGETRIFSQFLYPYQSIGPAAFANVDAAISVSPKQVGVATTRLVDAIVIVNGPEGSTEWRGEISPEKPLVWGVDSAKKVTLIEAGVPIATCELKETEARPIEPATEPALPSDVSTNDELFTIGQHLEQYRHATRSAADYWQEALRRDPGDSRCNNALGMWHFKRGEFETARLLFAKAIERLTSRNPNPYDGEPYYNLGLVCRFLDRDNEAFDAFAKATWNAAWQAASYHALGELACKRSDWPLAMSYLNKAIRKDQDNFKAHHLRTILLRKMGRNADSSVTLRLDPLDHWARYLNGEAIRANNGVKLDIAIDLMRAGLYEEALEVVSLADESARDGTAPMVSYYRGFIQSQLGKDPSQAYSQAATASVDYCFPSRLEDIQVLTSAPPDDARAAYFLGNLFYDRRRYAEAIEQWKKAVQLEPTNSIAYRNLGIAAFNVQRNSDEARACYDKAITLAPDDSRLWFERDQLWKRIGVDPKERLAALRLRPDLVLKRDDLTLEYCDLLNEAGDFEAAELIMVNRQFQPWEGGESMAMGVFTRTQFGLGHEALRVGDAEKAKNHFYRAAFPPENLGEARHMLANASDLWLACGDAANALGQSEEAAHWWRKAADFRGDFQEMAVQPYSELTYYQAVALERLGRTGDCQTLLQELQAYAERLLVAPAKIDYFATSLPTMLLFEDDLQDRQTIKANLILSQIASRLR